MSTPDKLLIFAFVIHIGLLIQWHAHYVKGVVKFSTDILPGIVVDIIILFLIF